MSNNLFIQLQDAVQRKSFRILASTRRILPHLQIHHPISHPMEIQAEATERGQALRVMNLSLIPPQGIRARKNKLSGAIILTAKGSWFHASFSTLSVKHQQAKRPSLHIPYQAPRELNLLRPVGMSADCQVIGLGEVFHMTPRHSPVNS